MDNKYYFNLSESKLSLEEAIADFKSKSAETANLKFVVLMNGRELIATEDENILSIISTLQDNKLKANDITVAALDEERRYTPDEWKQFKLVSELLKKENVSFGFEDMAKTWTIDEAENANNQISEISSKIKQREFSPYEKLLSAYFTVTSRPYIAEDENDHYSQSRSIYGVLNSEKIVCVGFSELFKAIIEDVGDENIKLFKNHVKVLDDDSTAAEGHQNLIVYLKDEKYGIDGYFYLDPTWDCAEVKGRIGFLNHFMVPLEDISKMKSQILDPNAAYRHSTDKVQPEKTKTEKKQTLFNKPLQEGLKFAGTDLIFSKEFLMFMAQNPEVKRKMVDIAFGNSVLNILNFIADEQADLKTYKQALEFLSKQEKLQLDYDDVQAYKEALSAAKEHDDISLFINAIKGISQKEKQEDPTQSFISQINTNLEKCIYEFDTQEQIEAKREKIKEITTSLEKLFSDPENALRLAQMPPAKKAYLFERVYSTMRYGDSEGFKEEVSYSLSTVKLLQDPVEDLQTRIEKTKSGLDRDMERLDELDSTPADVLADKIGFSCQEITDLLLEQSKTIDLPQISTALRKVLKENYDFADEAEIEKTVKQIIETNCEDAQKFFTEGASNAFSQNPPVKTDELNLE